MPNDAGPGSSTEALFKTLEVVRVFHYYFYLPCVGKPPHFPHCVFTNICSPPPQCLVQHRTPQAKFRLMQQMGKEKKLKREFEQKIVAMESKVFERRQRLGEYNALFMSLDGAAERAPRQKLGAREAVSGTKRIIDINLHKLSQEKAKLEMKLNRAQDRNLHLKEKVDLLRKEHITFRKLFASMGGDLEELREKINGDWS